MTKYNATKTEMDGFAFDSELEADTYLDLKRLHDNGAIANISMQQPFNLYARSGQVVAKYVADFVCELPGGKVVIVESKGMRTPVWQLKKKLFLSDYPHIALIEVRGQHQFPLDCVFPVFLDTPRKNRGSRLRK
jgi:hypothetical protein